jgi:hypothetical protein
MRSGPSEQRICQYPGPGVALKVKNLDKSLAFYTEKMGFFEMLRLNHDDGRVWLGIPMATGSSSWKWDPTLCN